MNFDLSWLSQEAHNIHAAFTDVFYLLAVVLLTLGVVLEYFKLPLGGVPAPQQLVGRVVIAWLMLISFPEITNALAGVTDALVAKIGTYSEFERVLAKLGERLDGASFSWTSLKNALILAISYLSFFLLYISVFITNSGVIFVWALLYVLSPLLIVLYILPGTASVTKAMYRSLFEVCGWKVLWVVLSALLWSSSYSTINGPASDVNLFTVVCLNLILAASLLFTPMIVSALAGAGLSGVTSGLMGLGAAATYFNPTSNVQKLVKGGASALRSKTFDGGKDDAGSRRQNVRPPKHERFSANRDGADASSSFPPDQDGH